MQENERKEQQAQDISEEMISQENISQEIGEEEPAEDTQEQGLLNITFIPNGNLKQLKKNCPNL